MQKFWQLLYWPASISPFWPKFWTPLGTVFVEIKKKTGEILDHIYLPYGKNLRYLLKKVILKIIERVNCPGQFSGSCFSQGAAKISEVSWRLKKKIADLARIDTNAPMPEQNWQFYFWPTTLTSDILQPPDQSECSVSHLKDIKHICLKTEAQGHDIYLKVCNIGLKHTPNQYVKCKSTQNECPQL